MPRMSSMYFRSATRSPVVRPPAAPSSSAGPAVCVAICLLPCREPARGLPSGLHFRVERAAGIAGRQRSRRTQRSHTLSRMERVWASRLRWRLTGATQWPAFALFVIGDAVLLHLLPIAGDGPDRWLCPFVFTDQHPPGLRLDTNRAPNSSWFPPDRGGSG